MPSGGKVNINKAHRLDSAFDFEITRLSSPGLPTPTDLELIDILNSDRSFRLNADHSCETGIERHQATLITLHHVELLSAADWAPGGALTLVDARDASLRFDLLLGRDPAFASLPAPVGSFSITGILDQEDGYRRWATNAAVAIPEPASFLLFLAGSGWLLASRRRAASH